MIARCATVLLIGLLSPALLVADESQEAFGRGPFFRRHHASSRAFHTGKSRWIVVPCPGVLSHDTEPPIRVTRGE